MRRARRSATNIQDSGSASAKENSSGRKIFRGAQIRPGRTRIIAGKHQANWKSKNRQRGRSVVEWIQFEEGERDPGKCWCAQTNHGATRRTKSARFLQCSKGRKRSRASRKRIASRQQIAAR